MPSSQQVATTLVSVAIALLALALLAGGVFLTVWGGRSVLGVAVVLVGLAVGAGAFFVVLSPLVAEGYDPLRRDEGEDDGT